jgi:EAL domain-containing protein (putative c-di-GMP-specific phosphodiesterase class I)
MIKSNGLSPDKEYLVRVHTCIHDKQTILPFIDKILTRLPKAKIIGCSTTGVIIEGNIRQNCCLVCITEFDDSTIRTKKYSLKNITGRELAQEVSDGTITDKSVFMLTFFAYPYNKVSDFVDSINSMHPSLGMIGGMACHHSHVLDVSGTHSFVFNETGVSGQSVVCAVIDSEKCSVYSDVVYVTEPVGAIHTITEADGRIIRSIDGENAVDWYQNRLGINFDASSSRLTSVFPLVRTNSGNVPWGISYSPQDETLSLFDDEPNPVMYVPDEAKAGEQIRIAYSSVQKTIETCENVCRNIMNHPSEVLFGYSCFSRQNMFSNCSKWELMPFIRTNLCGAILAGEIGNINGNNYYCNYSFTIASFAENKSYVKLDVDALTGHSDELVNAQENIIDYLINIASLEQDEGLFRQQQEIEDTLFIDDDTGLGNITKFHFDHNLGNVDKICMITIRNENLLKAFLSESKFQMYFNCYHKSIMDFINNDQYKCYIYKKTALIIAAAPEVTDNDFVNKMRELQNVITEFKFSSYIPVGEFSIVMHEEDIIKKAEHTLVRMRSRKDCFLVYVTELGIEQFNSHKMKMIMLLNDALSNGRIIPYFQGIRDNYNGDIKMYEALMRIEDVNGLVYTPGDFLEIAKEYGYYPDISYSMINKVMDIFRDRNEKVTINMNISDVYNYKIVHSILKKLENSPHPENFIFELTETEEIFDYPVVFEFVDKVHKAGGRIAIDDFGSGFSNIVNLFKINSDYIKIDGEIIKHICDDVYALEFLEMISSWAHRHEKEVIAEFVENDAIQKIVNSNSIKFSQGFLYSKPERRFIP